MTNRERLPPFPSGWYCVALSDDLPTGHIIASQFMGHDIVIFRTESGRPCLMEAYCPHLGAHLGHGGLVHEELIRCPFHFFEFDTSGVCVATGYNTKPPPLARARTWAVRETSGFLFAYHDDASVEARWSIPDVDVKGWTRPVVRTFCLRGHPQETTENSVDIGHLGIVHGYRSVEILGGLTLDGPYLNARYAMQRSSGQLLGQISAEFEVHVYGLGYSQVEVAIKSLGLNTRQFVFATPTDGEHIILRVGLSLKKITRADPLPSPLRLIPKPLLNLLLPTILMRGFVHDVSQDFVIWEHKAFVRPPALAEGDGPVGRYRQWARQFYTEGLDDGSKYER